MALPMLLGLGALGSGLGALGGLGGGFGGKKPRIGQEQMYTPEQRAALNTLLSQGLAGVDYEPLAAGARKSFQETTIPSIAERFTSMGSGAQRSSGFQSALGRAGSDLETQLAGLKAQLGMQKLGFGLTPQFQNYYQPEQQGMLQGALQGLTSMMPYMYGMHLQNKQQDNLDRILAQLGGR